MIFVLVLVCWRFSAFADSNAKNVPRSVASQTVGNVLSDKFNCWFLFQPDPRTVGLFEKTAV